MERVEPLKPLTPVQLVIATMLGLSYSHAEIAAELHITVGTVRDHLTHLAKRIPGDLPATARVIAWVRGASLDVLEGRTLRFEIMRDGRAASAEMAELERKARAAMAAASTTSSAEVSA